MKLTKMLEIYTLGLYTLVIGKKLLTIATWLKFDTRATTDVPNIPIFALW